MVGKKVALAVAGVFITISVTLFLLDGAVVGDLFGRVTLPSVGTVKAIGVGVYWDSSCSSQVTSVDWGTVEPGTTEDVTVYIRNEGDAPVILSSKTENWNPPSASSYMSLTWTYAEQVIDVGEVVSVTLRLAVSSTIRSVTTFSFDIVIIGSG